MDNIIVRYGPLVDRRSCEVVDTLGLVFLLSCIPINEKYRVPNTSRSNLYLTSLLYNNGGVR